MTMALPDQLIVATKRGELKKVSKWLRNGSLDAQRPSDGNTLLHTAVIHSQPDLVRDLVRRGATIDLANTGGSTPLMAACQIGGVLAVQLLLEGVADVNRQTKHGATALMSAARHNHPDELSLLLGASASVDMQTTGGETALMAAAAAGADMCVQILLDAGASTKLRNSTGATALRCAEMKGAASTQLLLQRFSKPSHVPSELDCDTVRIKMGDGACITVPEDSLVRRGGRCRSSITDRRALLSRALRG